MTSRPDEPLELFRRLPALEVGDDEIGRMQEELRVLRRAGEVQEQLPTQRSRFAPGLPAVWSAAAAAAVLLVVLLLPAVDLSSGIAEDPPAVSDAAVAERLERLPLVEELVPARAVYEIEAGDLDLVMIVGDGLDL